MPDTETSPTYIATTYIPLWESLVVRRVQVSTPSPWVLFPRSGEVEQAAAGASEDDGSHTNSALSNLWAAGLELQSSNRSRPSAWT